MQQPMLHDGDGHFSVRIAASGKNARFRQTTDNLIKRTHLAGAGAQVPLRSRTFCSPRLQLRTYYDNATMREALEQLKRTCTPFSLDDEEELSKMDPAHNSSNLEGLRLGRISGHVIVYCFTFCDLPSLCELSRVNRRLAALSNAHHLWETHARLRNVPTRTPESAREDFRRAVVEQREMWRAEVQRHEDEYEALERRLRERTAAERSVSVDVDAALSNSHYGDVGNNGSNSRTTRSAAEDQEMQAQLRQLESVKLDLLRDVRELKSTLAQQKQQIEEIQKWINGTDGVTEDGEDTTRGEKKTLSFLDLQLFERRICRIVLSTATELSLVLKRGVEDFGTMELLCLHGSGDVGGIVRQRWAAFKRFFPPLSDDYGTVRVLLSTGESPSSERSRECIDRLGGVIRRVQRMTDDEIVQIVM